LSCCVRDATEIGWDAKNRCGDAAGAIIEMGRAYCTGGLIGAIDWRSGVIDVASGVLYISRICVVDSEILSCGRRPGRPPAASVFGFVDRKQ
jgi:hypothetical protein